MSSPLSGFATPMVVALFVVAACTSAATPVPITSPVTAPTPTSAPILPTSPTSPATTAPPAATPAPTPAARTISGQVSYGGGALGSHQIVVLARGSGEQSPSPLYSVVLSGPGPYTLPGLPDNTYVVFAFIDLNDDMTVQPDEPRGQPGTGPAGLPVVVMSGGTPVTGADITILDQPAPGQESPAPTARPT